MTPGRSENLFNSDSNDNGNTIRRISANDPSGVYQLTTFFPSVRTQKFSCLTIGTLNLSCFCFDIILMDMILLSD